MPEADTRTEHLAWCKARALEYLDRGDLTNAVASMGSDLSKHVETRDDVFLQMGMFALVSEDSRLVRQWIEGFN